MSAESGVASARAELFNYLLCVADDALVIGHRLSEWCGHAPMLEEDIALANIALDCIGHATAFLDIASTLGDLNRSADELAFFRDPIDFRNATIFELPNGDFAHTIVRQFLVDAFRLLQLEALSNAGFTPLAAFASKALKEVRYHFRHSSSWVIRLGDGTVESHGRAQRALDELWSYVPELLSPLPNEAILSAADLTPTTHFEERWQKVVSDVLNEATLTPPPTVSAHIGYRGRSGIHTEHLGHLLAEMQSVARSAPGAKW